MFLVLLGTFVAGSITGALLCKKDLPIMEEKKAQEEEGITFEDVVPQPVEKPGEEEV